MSNSAAVRRIDWLDGLRALAVSLVILAHLSAVLDWRFVVPGKLGVFIFFGISGFIVTRLLLNERVQTGNINFAAFFARRSARILPPLTIYICMCLAMGQGDIGGALRAASFTCNIAKGPGDCGWIFGQTWSLAFEEQYYLLIPFILMRRARWALLVIIPLAFLPFVFPLSFIGRIGAIQIYLLLGLGALVALYEEKVFVLFANIPTIFAVLLLVFSGVWTLMDPSLIQIATGLFVPAAVISGSFALGLSSSWTNALLSSAPLRTLGLYSYTLYLWQQLALTNPAPMPPLVGLAGALLLSALSFHTVERFARKLVKRSGKTSVLKAAAVSAP